MSGESGTLEIPRIGLGTYKLAGASVVSDTVFHALSLGYRHIVVFGYNHPPLIPHLDTARIYKNEKYIGEALRRSDVPRNQIFITSKLSPYELSYDGAYNAICQSLADLGVDYIDLYLIHWPAKNKLPLDSPTHAVLRKETWQALERAHSEGKCRFIGVSNFTIAHVGELLEFCTVRPYANQIELHPKLQQRELRKFCAEHNVIVIPYSSLGRGNLLDHEIVVEIADSINKTPAQVLLRWAVEKGMEVIPKTENPERLQSNLDVDSFTLSEEQIERLDSLEDGTHYCWNPEGVK